MIKILVLNEQILTVETNTQTSKQQQQNEIRNYGGLNCNRTAMLTIWKLFNFCR